MCSNVDSSSSYLGRGKNGFAFYLLEFISAVIEICKSTCIFLYNAPDCFLWEQQTVLAFSFVCIEHRGKKKASMACLLIANDLIQTILILIIQIIILSITQYNTEQMHGN